MTTTDLRDPYSLSRLKCVKVDFLETENLGSFTTFTNLAGTGFAEEKTVEGIFPFPYCRLILSSDGILLISLDCVQAMESPKYCETKIREI